MAATKKTPLKKSPTPGTALAKVKQPEGSNIALLRSSMNTMTQGLENMAALLSKPDVPATVLAAAYNLIDGQWKKIIEDQREAVRLALLSLHETAESDELTYSYDGKTYVSKTTLRRATEPDRIALMAECNEKGLPPDACLSQEVRMVYDEEKALKIFTREQLDGMRKVISKSLSLKVR